jgi:crotonobetainyl-CoA:carnitine CoA-transferase CaiB-like acyl-CoA transferase
MSAKAEAAARAPKVRTSHHRNKEEAARLQELVDKRYAKAEAEVGVRDALEAILNTTTKERQNPAVWFKRVDAARAALAKLPAKTAVPADDGAKS